jgi:hypothetical protein
MSQKSKKQKTSHERSKATPALPPHVQRIASAFKDAEAILSDGVFTVKESSFTGMEATDLIALEKELQHQRGRLSALLPRDLNTQIAKAISAVEEVEKDLRDARVAFTSEAGENAAEPEPGSPYDLQWWHVEQANLRLQQEKMHLYVLKKMLSIKSAITNKTTEPYYDTIRNFMEDFEGLIDEFKTANTLKAARRNLERATSLNMLDAHFKSLQEQTTKTKDRIFGAVFKAVKTSVKNLASRGCADAMDIHVQLIDKEIEVEEFLKQRFLDDTGNWQGTADRLLAALITDSDEKARAKKKIEEEAAKKAGELDSFDEKIAELELNKKKFEKPLLDRMNKDELTAKLCLLAVIEPGGSNLVKGGIYELFRRKADNPETDRFPQGNEARTWPNYIRKLGGYTRNVNAVLITYEDALIGGDRSKAFELAKKQLRARLSTDFKLPESFQSNFILPKPE